jgi:hypothetical protein
MKQLNHKINNLIDCHINNNLNYFIRDYLIFYINKQVEYNIRRIVIDGTNKWFTMQYFQIKEKLENYELSLDK